MRGSAVRKPAVAGTFYPGDPRRLRADISRYLDNVATPPVEGRPVALIAPHAGYMYSGQIAAHGYSLLANRGIRTVVVVSPSHMEHFQFASVFPGDAYETPLGTIPVDTDLARSIVGEGKNVRFSGRGHVQHDFPRREHALEVQLPFLQVVLGDFSVVPIVMGDQGWAACESLGDALRPHVSRSDLVIVASSDLSHFYDTEIARRKDALFCELLEGMNPGKLYEAVASAKCEACGAGPVIATVIATAPLSPVSCRVLRAANSGDITGERDRVVGYASAVIVAPDDTNPKESLTDKEQRYLLRLARHRIEQSLGHAQDPPVREADSLDRPGGAFVTLKIGNRLRGCIGHIDADAPLKDTVAQMAVAAALHDPRFPALTVDELPDVRIEISILSPCRSITTTRDITVGIDGLIVERYNRRGLLLPQVAAERNWDAKTFLEQTCVKAGLSPDAWREPETAVFAFRANVFSEGDGQD